MNGLAVLVSRTGTLLPPIRDHVPIDLVIADRHCRAYEVAQQFGIESYCIERKNYGEGRGFDRRGYTEIVLHALKKKGIGQVAMAGWGTVFHEIYFEHYAERTLNCHPSLLPHFKGWNAEKQALEAGVKWTGWTIHEATAELDAGPILYQGSVPVKSDDSVETLRERINVALRQCYPPIIAQRLEMFC